MRCEDAIETIRGAATAASVELREARTHAESCDDCRAAQRALDALREIRNEPEPAFDERAVERAIDRAFRESPQRRYRRGFWSGMASGAALAAAVATMAVGISLFRGADDARTVPEVRIALNQRSNVTMTLETVEALAGAEVRVELRGALALDGYEGQRELRWSTNLDRGVNQLTLPVVASQASGGQVLVEVTHGDKRRTFVLDVRVV
jgi:ferric-dicitrate binding protein FerR (iron transport regulator)